MTMNHEEQINEAKEAPFVDKSDPKFKKIETQNRLLAAAQEYKAPLVENSQLQYCWYDICKCLSYL